MQLGMIGLGRMGANMVQRLAADGHHCVVYDRDVAAASAMAGDRIRPVESLEQMVEVLDAPRAAWMMVPAAVVESVVDEMSGLLERDDVLVDGGNSFYRDAMRRSARLVERGVGYVDVGVSGGVWGREGGYCCMAGGTPEAFARIEPVLRTLAPGVDAAPRTSDDGPVTPAEMGYLHCGPSGAGHFVKMVHNGVEYGLMAAYAEGLAVLEAADAGAHPPVHDAETAPLREPDAYRFELDIAAIAELWRRGSVVRSWLLDLSAAALSESPHLEEFAGRVSDSGEGRWTAQAAIDLGVPAPVLTVALGERFASRGDGEFAMKLLSAMRRQFGGHEERK